MNDRIQVTNVVTGIDGITTALVAFALFCLIVPSIVKNKAQYYASIACLLAIILLHSLGLMIRASGFVTFSGVATGLLQAAVLLLLVMCVGGLSPRELAGELKGAYEVMRRGSEEKEVIIPLSGQQPIPRDEPPPPTRMKLEDDG
jgi:hypothetical protein